MPAQVYEKETIHGSVKVQPLGGNSDGTGRFEVWHDDRPDDGRWQLDVHRGGQYDVHTVFGVDAVLEDLDEPEWVETIAGYIGDRA